MTVLKNIGWLNKLKSKKALNITLARFAPSGLPVCRITTCAIFCPVRGYTSPRVTPDGVKFDLNSFLYKQVAPMGHGHYFYQINANSINLEDPQRQQGNVVNRFSFDN